MIYRSKAPLRIGLAGGGTDVSPYCDIYGGAILNATISLYANAMIEPVSENKIILQSIDRNEEQHFDWNKTLPIDGTLDLLKGIYNRIQKDYGINQQGFKLSTYVDAPAGSGLGTSSTLVVAIIGAFTEMLRLPLGEYDMAHYAYDIELKEQARQMKEALLKGKIHELGEILDFGFQQKRQMAEGISNPLIEEIYQTAKKAGATGGKISGAGGGGFMIFYCPGNTKYDVIKNLEKFGGRYRRYKFTEHGLTTWTI